MVREHDTPAGKPRHRLLDPTDSKILSLLQLNGRAAYREIARELGVSEGTVRSRANRMQAEGVLTIAAIADPAKLGYSVMAFTLLTVQIGQQQAVIDALMPWDEITYISSCTGRADLYVQFVCRDHEHLWQILHERLPEVAGVTGAETFQEIKMHKVSYVYPNFAGGTASVPAE
ncbi:Lrp/AsnC family transcriptional regulator [Saccharopolyspora sp. K220]|uniref:Lrp/AsnC family transcriptional regulator n=1 Tax=Saccharopolyspora soli TaxID=2926618 RepID=UPI001F576AD9|nr:Lrp/AsnC family transcriptional regulator [Saccharopolyspora soli]MCI2417347.1 Lrp/AsnC family transcriptional regulator [Saccharopolyspora soli]